MSLRVVPSDSDSPGASSLASRTLEPLFPFLLLCGLDLKMASRSNLGRVLSRLWLCLWLLLDLGSVALVSYVHLDKLSRQIRDETYWTTQTFSASAFLVVFSRILQVVASHLGLVYVTVNQWPRLWPSLQSGRELGTEGAAFRRGRWMAVAALAYLVLMESVLMVGAAVNWANIHLWYSRWSMLLTLAMEMYPAIVVVLFCLSSWTLASCLAAVARDVDRCRASVELASSGQVTSMVAQWRREYNSISDAVGLLSGAFGPMLFVEVVTAFIQVVIRELIHLVAIGAAADGIKHEAIKIHGALGRWSVASAEHQVSHLMTYIHQSIPEVKPLQLVTINRRLFVTVVASTLTYVTILYQMQASDDKSHLKIT